jgi:quercetin dioxygenase-like cupin family protein
MKTELAAPAEPAPERRTPLQRLSAAHLYPPGLQRPLRANLLHLSAETRVVPHRHPWAQLAVSATGVVRLTADRGTYIVPPTRALWIPAGVEHAVTVLEDAELLTLYLHQPRGHCGPQVARALEADWRQCRVLEVSDLLRALALELDTTPDGGGPPLGATALQRERRLSALIFDELRRARPVALRSGAREPDAAHHARRLGPRFRRQPAHRGAPVPQRARHLVRTVAPAGAAGARGQPRGTQDADGGHRRRARLRQPERLQCDGAAFDGRAAEPLLRVLTRRASGVKPRILRAWRTGRANIDSGVEPWRSGSHSHSRRGSGAHIIVR